MARNEEKQLTQLNRLHLQKLREEELEKNPLRPQLRYLDTAAEIQKWLPNIKRDMHIALAQTQVPCYTDNKVDEYRREVDKLQREYMAFVRKLRNLNPNVDVTPWTSRGYSKRKLEESENLEESDQSVVSSLPKRINLPIMELPTNRAPPPPPELPQPEHQDRPLEFTSFGPPKMNFETFTKHHSKKSVERNLKIASTSAKTISEFDSLQADSNVCPTSRTEDHCYQDNVLENLMPTSEEKRTVVATAGTRSQPRMTLNLVADYSSSSSEEDLI